MRWKELIKRMVKKLHQLSEQDLLKVNDLSEFLLSRIDKRVSEEISNTNILFSSFKFLQEDADIYTVNDLKKKY